MANPSSPSYRREAVPLHVGQLRLAFRPLRRADPTLQEAHWGEAVQVHSLQPLLLPLGPPGSAHEAPPELMPSSPQWKSGTTISHGHRGGARSFLSDTFGMNEKCSVQFQNSADLPSCGAVASVLLTKPVNRAAIQHTNSPHWHLHATLNGGNHLFLLPFVAVITFIFLNRTGTLFSSSCKNLLMYVCLKPGMY